ncbi:hypothetical protein BURMUCF2_A1764 [Burkholderia multivorans CF2]|nr:hypothetical protein BURMUCF2_A1764 [Burkholderia multivorans CF2]
MSGAGGTLGRRRGRADSETGRAYARDAHSRPAAPRRGAASRRPRTRGITNASSVGTQIDDRHVALDNRTRPRHR